MSLYTFAAANLTTPADLRRRPAIDRGQLVRTLVLFVAMVLAMTIAVHRGNAGIGVGGSTVSSGQDRHTAV